jgi:hypothetical protein
MFPAPLLFIAITGILLPADSIVTENATATSNSRSAVYGFGTDFSARVLHNAIFQYGLDVEDNAKIVYNAIPLEGIRCGFDGDFTGGIFETITPKLPSLTFV